MNNFNLNSIKRFPESLSITQEEAKKSESIHYKGRPVTELESNFIQPEPKLVIEKESYDMIYKSGYTEALNHLEKFIQETRGFDLNVSVWIDQQRKTLNKYL